MSAEPARAAAVRLSDALERAGFAGGDPYDALSSPFLRRVARGRLARGAAIQALNRSPVDLRPFLRVPKKRHAKGLALAVSAYTRLARLEPEGRWASLADGLARDLAGRAAPEGGFGYDFDVQTRWGFYRAGEPNAVMTAFAAEALLDAGGDHRATGERAAAWALSRLAVDTAAGPFFAYYAGSRVPIHHANVLVAALAGRVGAADAARDAVAFTLSRRRPDGSWPYGEGPGLEWVDGYHTMYVLDALDRWERATGDAAAAAALGPGLDLYLARLLDPDGAPRATLDSRFPLEAHAAGPAIGGLAGLSARDPRALPAAGRVLAWTLGALALPDGRFAFRQGRRRRNDTRYVRWSDGHMLLGLARYLEAVA